MSQARNCPRRTTSLAVAAVALLALAGCGDDEKKPDARPSGDASASSSSSTSPSRSASADDTPGGTEVELLAAGAAPQRVLELDLEEGHEESTDVRLDMTFDYGAGGPLSLPMSLPFTTTVTRADDDGYAADLVYGKPSLDTSGLPAGTGPIAEKGVAIIEGATLHTTYGRNGVQTSSELEVGDDAPDLVRRVLDNLTTQGFAMSVPFPDEAVGVGAQWRSTSTLDMGGFSADITSTYELTALTDGGYTVRVRSVQRTVPGTVPGGGKVVSGRSTGSGTVTGRTGLVSPVDAVTQLDGDSTVDVGGQQVRTTFSGTTRITTR